MCYHICGGTSGASVSTPEKKFVCDFKDCIYNPEHCKLPLCKEYVTFLKTTSVFRQVSDCEAGLQDTNMSTRSFEFDEYYPVEFGEEE